MFNPLDAEGGPAGYIYAFPNNPRIVSLVTHFMTGYTWTTLFCHAALRCQAAFFRMKLVIILASTIPFKADDSGACNASGDLICDTNPQDALYGFDCNSYQSCGSADPDRNYMNYGNGSCFEDFTSDQIQACCAGATGPNLARWCSLGLLL